MDSKKIKNSRIKNRILIQNNLIKKNLIEFFSIRFFLFPFQNRVRKNLKFLFKKKREKLKINFSLVGFQNLSCSTLIFYKSI